MAKPQLLFTQKDNQGLTKDLRQVYDWVSRLDVTTSAPNGNRQGRIGEAIFYNNAGTFTLYVNTTGSTVWQQI